MTDTTFNEFDFYSTIKEETERVRLAAILNELTEEQKQAVQRLAMSHYERGHEDASGGIYSP